MIFIITSIIRSFRLTYEKSVSLGMKLDLIFHQIRIGLFYMDHDLITRNLEKAQELIESGGDWDRKNRLKVRVCVTSGVVSH